MKKFLYQRYGFSAINSNLFWRNRIMYKKIGLSLVGMVGLLSISMPSIAETVPAEEVKEVKEVKKMQGEYIDWRLLGVSHRNDKKTLRAILGNDIAIKASRNSDMQVWPDGSIIAKLIWKESVRPNWPAAIVPGEFSRAEAMIKDSKKFASTGGWGFGAWKDGVLTMHSKEKSATCFACHMPMKAQDYVYTVPVK